MRIAIVGATGQVGSHAAAEALRRGHQVTAVVRHPDRAALLPAGVRSAVADAAHIDDILAVYDEQEVVIAATRPPDGRENELVTTTAVLLDAAAKADVRLLIAGGAGSLVVPGSGGATVADSPRFMPAAYRAIALACTRQLELCRSRTDAEWTYLSPPAYLAPGTRTGTYRTGRDELLVDTDGNSTISLEDFAVALLDEAEQPAHPRARFTVAY